MFTVFTYFLPIFAMSFAYFQVGRDLWGSKGIGECTIFQLENIRSKRKVNTHHFISEGLKFQNFF